MHKISRSLRTQLYNRAAFAALALGTGAPISALAQSDDVDLTNVDSEIVVIGRFQNSLINRLPVEASELPYSLDVIDRDFLDERGFIRPLEALQVIPNVVPIGESFSSGNIDFLIRGFSASILVNNRPESGSRGFGRRDNAFVERYEVLKGPASISLGPVLPGGIINTVTKSPEADPFIDLELRGGSFGTFRGELDANGGYLLDSDVVSGRITFAYENTDFANDIADREIFAVRPVFEVNISPRTRSVFSVAYREANTVPDLNFAVFQDGTIPASFTNDTFFGPIVGVAGDANDLLADGEIQHDFLDNLKLTVRGSYQDTNLDYTNAQGLYQYFNDQKERGISPTDPVGNFYASTGSFDEDVTYVDTQLAWTENPLFGGTFDIVVGGTYQLTDTLSTFVFDDLNTTVDITNFNPTLVPDPRPLNTGIPTPFFDLEQRTLSVYSELVVRPVNWLTVIGGVRYDDLRNEIVDPTADGDDISADDSVQDTRETFDNVSFRIGATAEVTEGVRFYASFAESFIPQAGLLADRSPIGPETAVSYEVGTKSQLFDGRVNITAALFNTLRQNVSTPVTTATGFTFSQPIGEQRHRGFEISINGDITPQWKYFISYGYLDAEITEGVEEAIGLRATVAPENTFSSYTSYTFDGGTLDQFQIGGGVRFLSERPGAEGTNLRFDGYTLVDLFASYPLGDRFKVQINANNLLNETYLESTGNNGNVSGGFNFGEPRTVLATFNARF
ncbi:MAG: TonB-dependent siderophore receptor [Pseudomonadota bacterium]